MRKMISFICVLVVCMLLAGCRKDGLSDMGYNGGVKAIEILEKYKSFEISFSNADYELEQIYDALNNSKNQADKTVATYVLIASCHLITGQDIDEAIEKIEKAIYD